MLEEVEDGVAGLLLILLHGYFSCVLPSLLLITLALHINLKDCLSSSKLFGFSQPFQCLLKFLCAHD
jgi:hypothetical protein